MSFPPAIGKLPKVDFDSSLASLIISLEHLRKRKLTGTTFFAIFFQLKNIFHTLESIGSARIEGNNTTVAEYIEAQMHPHSSPSQSILEIQNIAKAMDFIDKEISAYPINHSFIRELHRQVVTDLSHEGDNTPGQYRTSNVLIADSQHQPPEQSLVHSLMTELIDFINQAHEGKYDLLKTAIAHHAFTWIHPFANGNGRTVRLLTYAMLVKQGFNIDEGRILNPVAVFCSDRNQYYNYLALADTGQQAGILKWCEYVLQGLHHEIEKIDKLLNHEYLKIEVLYPAIENATRDKHISALEAEILKKAAEMQVFKAADIKSIIRAKHSVEISRVLNKLKEKKMIMTLAELYQTPKKGERIYLINFQNNVLFRSIIKILGEKGFLPLKD